MLHVTLLGEQAITDDGTGSVRVRSSRTVALVAFLAIHAGSPQARQRIAGLFWPDSTDAQALTNLRRELHNLRQVLGDRAFSRGDVQGSVLVRHARLTRVDVRTFDVERKAALAAAAAGDARVSSRTPPVPSRSTAATSCQACTTTGCSTPERSLSASAWTCAIFSVRHVRAGVTWQERSMPPAAASSCSRWRRSAIAP